MATSGNDVLLVQNTSPDILGGLSGDDTYIISGSLLTDTPKEITISDTDGSNSIQLVDGLEIASSVVAGTALQITLTNGVVINVNGADTFTYEPGGNATAGIDEEDVSYSDFVTDTLGTTVPEGDETVAGDAVTIGEGDEPTPNLIEGTDGDDVITPADDADFVTTDADETLRGGDGNDLLDGGGGADTVQGDSGNDTLVGDPDDPVLDGGEGFDRLQTGAVSDSTFGVDGDDISLRPVSNVELIDATNSEGGNTLDLSDLLIDSITGGSNTFGVLEDSLTFAVGDADDEIDLGDVTQDKVIRIIGDTTNLDVINPNSVRVVNLTEGDNAVLNGGDFTVPAGASFYIGTDNPETITADFANLDSEDTIAAAGGEDILFFTGSAVPGELPLDDLEYVSGIDVIAGDAAVNGDFVLTNELLGQLVRGEPDVDEADTLTVVVDSLTINTQDVGQDDTVILENGDFTLANTDSDPTLLQGNIVTISDEGAGTILGGNGNDSIQGGEAGDTVNLAPEPPRSVASGDNVVSGAGGNDVITAGSGQDSLSGDEGDDTFNFGLNTTSGASRLNANDTVSGGEGTGDVVNLAANTRLTSQSEVQNVTGVETIQLNGDADSPVFNQVTLIDNLVDTTTDDATLTIDASGNFTLSDDDDALDRNVIDLKFLAPDSQVVVEGGNASERLIFSDESFNGLSDLDGGQGGINPASVGLPIPERFVIGFTPDPDGNGISGVPLPVTTEAIRTSLADTVTNVDTLDFRADGGDTFTADPTDFNNVAGFEEIQLTNSQNLALSNFNITLTDEIVRELTQPAASNDPTNLFISLDVIDQIGTNDLGLEISPNSNINIDASELTSTLNTVTVLNPNGANINVTPPTPGLPTRVTNVSADNITSAELAQAQTEPTGSTIFNDYANAAVTVTVANNSFDNVADLDFGAGRGVNSGAPALAAPTAHTITTGDGSFIVTTYDGADFDNDGVLDPGEDLNGDGFIDGRDNITTGNGDDQIDGGDANDTIQGGAGADTLDGGEGDIDGAGGTRFIPTGGANDTVSYSLSDASVTVDLGAGTASGGHADGDVFIFFDSDNNGTLDTNTFESAAGSGFDDTLTGDGRINVLTGNAGDDALTALAGADTLNGGAGLDTLDAGNGADLLNGGIDNDTLNGGQGPDTIDGGDIQGDVDTDTLTYATSSVGVNVDLDPSTVGAADGSGITAADPLVQIDTDGDGILDATGFFVPGAQPANSPAIGDFLVTIDQDGDGVQDTNTINNLSGSIANDTLVGDDDPNTLNGLAGDDIVVGDTGSDVVIGGAGNDTLGGDDITGAVGGGADLVQGDAGDDVIFVDNDGVAIDTLEGGDGTDVLDFSNLTGPVQIDLTTGSSSTGDIFTEIEDVIGTAAGDTFTANADENTFTGNAGADTFVFNSVAAAGDAITDFDPVNGDQISLSVSGGFEDGGAGAGVDLLDADLPGGAVPEVINAFVFNSGVAAEGSNISLPAGVTDPNLPTYVFEQSTGRLAFDADGEGGSSSVQDIASLSFDDPTFDPFANVADAQALFAGIDFA